MPFHGSYQNIDLKLLKMTIEKIKQDLEQYNLDTLTPNNVCLVRKLICESKTDLASALLDKLFAQLHSNKINIYFDSLLYTCLLELKWAQGKLDEAEIIYKQYFSKSEIYTTEYLIISGRFTEAKQKFFETRQFFKRNDAENKFKFILKTFTRLTKFDLIELFSYEPSSHVKSEEVKDVATIDSQNSYLLGVSQHIQKLRQEISKISQVNLATLILGETGTGKEIVAKEIHRQSDRCKKPFVAVNCNALSELLIESELFGHVEGAFSGASKNRIGLFESAQDGILFLDEIGDIPLRLQASLLRTLETSEIRPVGSSVSKKIQCRVLFATNVDFEKLIQEGKFRSDLYYRISQFVIQLQPLRNRKEDILFFANYFIHGEKITDHSRFSKEAENALKEYAWPGNIRQLKNIVERMVIFNSKKLYEVNDLEEKIRSPSNKITISQKNEKTIIPFQEPSSSESLIEKSHQSEERINRRKRLKLLKALFLKHEELTRKEIAKLLGISPPTATEDLKVLLTNGFIKKVEPSLSTRSHYFIIAETIK